MRLLSHAVAASALVAAGAAQGNTPDFSNAVYVRVEGSGKTTAEGFVFNPKPGFDITTDSGGTHKCDGTNYDSNSTPGPTCTTTMAELVGPRNITFDGTYSTEFDDFFITRIGTDDSNTSRSQFWGVLENFAFTPAGGCQTEANPPASVMWYFDAFNKNRFLRLRSGTGTLTATAGQPFTLSVSANDGNGNFASYGAANVMSYDPKTGMAISGGKSVATDSSGTASITETKAGVYFYKAYDDANRSGRSNLIRIKVKKAPKSG